MHTCLPSLVAWISLRIARPILGIMQHTQVCRVDTLIICCKRCVPEGCKLQRC